MKKLFPILLLCLCAISAQAYTFVTLTFTNIPTNGCSWTLNGATVLWTNAPLNSTTWIQTNGIAGSATNLVRRLGAQYSSVSAVQTNSTNIIISGGTVNFSIVGNYGVCVTNSFANNTNRILLDLPFDYMFDTNRTNAADALIDGLGKYARTSSIPATAKGWSNFVNLAQVQTTGNKTITNSAFQGGTNSATQITNSTFGGGTLAGTITSVATVSGGTYSGPTLTNASGHIKDAYETNCFLDKPFLTNATIISATVTGSVFTVTGSGLGVWMTVDSSSTTASLGPIVSFTRSDGASSFVETGDVLMHLVASGYGDTGQKPGARIRAYALTNFTDANAPTTLIFETTPIGSITTVPRLHIGEDLIAVTNTPFTARSGITNQVFRGTNVFNSEICLTPRSASGFGNGYNSGFSLRTNAYIRISGPSGAYTNSSFTGGYAGLVVFYEADNPASSFVILHRSSIGAPTSAEQVNTTTGNLVNQTNNPATGWLIHNGTEWILGPHSD